MSSPRSPANAVAPVQTQVPPQATFAPPPSVIRGPWTVHLATPAKTKAPAAPGVLKTTGPLPGVLTTIGTPPRIPEPPVEPSKVEIGPKAEGKRQPVLKLVPVRDAALRAEAVRIHGNACLVCHFRFDAHYDPGLAQGYIEVHHLRPVSRGKRITDPRTDLITICANCHKMADRAAQQPDPPRTLDELRARVLPRSPDLSNRTGGDTQSP